MSFPVSNWTRVLLLALCTSVPAWAAPFTPSSDAEIVERLPASGGDPALRRVDSLRKQLAARPGDTALRLEIARRYFDLAMAQGDPRYVGYASATIQPLAQTAAGSAQYWLIRGLLQQYGHDFSAAIQSLRRAAELDPQSAEPISWQAAIQMVQARYPEALSQCTRLAPMAHALYAQGCTAYVQASTGHLVEAYEGLRKQLASSGTVAPELALWVRTRLAEMAIRLRRLDEAQSHFKEAFALAITDQFLLAAYADFLLMQQRPQEAIKLLVDWERSDVLLLRLALAGQAAGDSRAAGWIEQLRERFAAAALRGDRLHEQEAARFELDLARRPDRALALASRNYQTQKEPRDAEMLLRAALAVKQPKAAQPALDWLRSSGYEDPSLARLAEQLAALGTTR